MLQVLLQDDAVLDMANIQTSFTNIRKANGIEKADVDRRTIKKKLLEHFSDIQFAKPLNPKESERVFLKSVGDKAVQNVSSSSCEDQMETIFKSAKILRDVLAKKCSDGWTFQGSLQNTDDHVPPELYSFLRWLMIGPATHIDNKDRDDNINRKVITISDVILDAFKSNRQVGYKSKTTSQTTTLFHAHRDWPLQLGVGIAVHQ